MANRFLSPNQQFCDENGLPYALGTLSFYASTTSTPLDTYSNRALTSARTNPVVLDSAGRSGAVFLQDLAYKVVLADANAVQIWTADPVYSSDFSTVAMFRSDTGSPNGVVAGTAGSAGVPASVYWDVTNNILYVATTTGTVSTTVWTAINASTAAAVVPTPQGRLTLYAPGIPVTTPDVIGVAAIYYTPYGGNIVPIYNGSSFTPTTFTELTLSLVASHAANTNYDVFIFNNSGVVTIGSGPAWSSATARGTGAGTTELTTISGLSVNNVSMTARNASTTYTVPANRGIYLGTFRTTGTNGLVSDGFAFRQLWNCYNRVPRLVQVIESVTSWNYSNATWRQAHANTANQFAMVAGLAEDATSLRLKWQGTSNAATSIAMGLGLDSTTAPTLATVLSVPSANFLATADVPFCVVPGLGYHTITWLEKGSGVNTQTWSGTGLNDAADTYGIFGTVLA